MRVICLRLMAVIVEDYLHEAVKGYLCFGWYFSVVLC